MNFEFSHNIDSIKDGTKEVAETAQAKTSEFHENYVSKVLPDCGKYGDVAKFVAEMAPGVSEYNAIREGDWQAFAIAAGIDVASIAIGAVTLGAGYGAVKGGTVVAKEGAKVATKEIAEAGAKKAVKEVAEAGAKKAVKEVAEAGAKKAVKEVAEAGAEKVVKEVAEAGAEKVVKEVAEAGAEKVVKEAAEAGAEKVVKEAAEAGAEKVSKEVIETGTEKAVKEVAEARAEKVVKEAAEAGTEKVAKEATEAGTEKTVKEVAEAGAEKITKEAVESGVEKTTKEVTEASVEKAEKTILEVGDKIDKTRFTEYLDEIEKITKREIPAQQKELLDHALKENDYFKLDKTARDVAYREFQKIKKSLIQEWEINTGNKWPRYVDDVLNEAGAVIRKAGDYYDAHHVIELSTRGPNKWWNLVPASFPIEHQCGIHGAGSLARVIFG